MIAYLLRKDEIFDQMNANERGEQEVLDKSCGSFDSIKKLCTWETRLLLPSCTPCKDTTTLTQLQFAHGNRTIGSPETVFSEVPHDDMVLYFSGGFCLLPAFKSKLHHSETHGGNSCLLLLQH